MRERDNTDRDNGADRLKGSHLARNEGGSSKIGRNIHYERVLELCISKAGKYTCFLSPFGDILLLTTKIRLLLGEGVDQR